MKRAIALTILLAIFAIPALAQEHAAPALDGHYWWNQFIKFFNIALVVGALIYFLRKPVIGFFRKRADQIEDDLQAAERARVEAEKRLQEVEAEVAALEVKVQEIKDSAAKEGEVEKQRIIDNANEEAARIVANAEREIENRIKSGRAELKRYAAQLAVERARKLIEDRMDDSTDKAIIERTLDGIGGGR